MTPELLIVIGVVLAGTGATMVWAAAAPDRRRRRKRAQPCRRRWSGALMCTALIGGVIAGLQWVLLDSTIPAPAADPVRAVALGLPAFLAGATLFRLVRAIGAAVDRYRGRRRILRAEERGGRR
jgi:hypothetical protein